MSTNGNFSVKFFMGLVILVQISKCDGSGINQPERVVEPSKSVTQLKIKRTVSADEVINLPATGLSRSATSVLGEQPTAIPGKTKPVEEPVGIPAKVKSDTSGTTKNDEVGRPRISKKIATKSREIQTSEFSATETAMICEQVCGEKVQVGAQVWAAWGTGPCPVRSIACSNPGREIFCGCGCSVCVAGVGEKCNKAEAIVCGPKLFCGASVATLFERIVKSPTKICQPTKPTTDKSSSGSSSAISEETVGKIVVSIILGFVFIIFIVSSVYLIKVIWKHTRQPSRSHDDAERLIRGGSGRPRGPIYKLPPPKYEEKNNSPPKFFTIGQAEGDLPPRYPGSVSSSTSLPPSYTTA